MTTDLAEFKALHTEPTRTKLSGMMVTMFDNWGLSSTDGAELLGFKPGSAMTMSRYRKGSPLADSRDLLDRVGNLLGIHKSLRIIFPQNRELAYRWMMTRNRHFEYQTPVDVIKEHGFPGLMMVRSYLDRERGQ